MLIFAALAPHPPLLIPNTNINKDHLEQIQATHQALELLMTRLADLQPDTIIIISSHGSLVNHISINLSTKYESNFQEFGNFNVPLEFRSDLKLIAQLRELFITETDDKFVLTSSTAVDHGISIPLSYFSKIRNNYQIVPVAPMISDLKYNFLFGNIIQDEILRVNKRIAIIISGDLAHTVDYAPSKLRLTNKFNEDLIRLILNKDTEAILNIDLGLTSRISECSIASLLILLGVLKDVNYAPKLFSYELAFGVGYSVIELY